MNYSSIIEPEAYNLFWGRVAKLEYAYENAPEDMKYIWFHKLYAIMLKLNIIKELDKTLIVCYTMKMKNLKYIILDNLPIIWMILMVVLGLVLSANHAGII